MRSPLDRFVSPPLAGERASEPAGRTAGALGRGRHRPRRDAAIRQSPFVQHVVRFLLRAYLKAYHQLDYSWPRSIPSRGPYIAITSHFSILDTITLMVVDPYRPLTTLVVKESAWRTPVVGSILRAWGAIPVARDRRDLLALRRIDAVLREGRGICIAGEGTRSRSGRLGPMNAALMKIVLRAACDGVPVFPVVETGTREALPPGAVMPRPARIGCYAGPPIDLSAYCAQKATTEVIENVGRAVQSGIAALLPPERRPAEGTPAIGSFV